MKTLPNVIKTKNEIKQSQRKTITYKTWLLTNRNKQTLKTLTSEKKNNEKHNQQHYKAKVTNTITKQ